MSNTVEEDRAPLASTPQSPQQGDGGHPIVTITEAKPDTPATPSEAEPEIESNLEPKQADPEDGHVSESIAEDGKSTGDDSKNDGGGDKETGEGSQQGAAEETPATGESEKGADSAPAASIETDTDAPKEESGNVAAPEEKKEEENDKADGEANEDGKTDYKDDIEGDGTEAKNEEKAAEVADVKSETAEESEHGDVPTTTSEAPKEEPLKTAEPDINPDVAGESEPQNANNPSTLDAEKSAKESPPTNEDAKTGATAADSVDGNNDQGESSDLHVATERQPDDTLDHNANEKNGGSDAPGVAATDDDTKVKAVESEMDWLKSENSTLRKKLKDVDDELERIREGRKEGTKVQAEYLARELNQQQDTEKYLREKLAEVLQEKEEGEQRLKTAQLRLKRFVKDDQAKDARMTKMEKELRDINHEVSILESMVDEETLRRVHEQRASGDGNANGPSGGGGGMSTVQRGNNKSGSNPPTPQSKTCVIL